MKTSLFPQNTVTKVLKATAALLPTLLLLLAVVPARAADPAVSTESRFQASINDMVQNVQAAQDPAAKREIIGNFLNRIDRGMGIARFAVSKNDRPALDAMRANIQSQYAELNGLKGSPKVADADLNHFAVYIQQDMEQAGINGYWGRGGGYYGGRGGFFIYGGGFIILILILILLLEAPYYSNSR